MDLGKKILTVVLLNVAWVGGVAYSGYNAFKHKDELTSDVKDVKINKDTIDDIIAHTKNPTFVMLSNPDSTYTKSQIINAHDKKWVYSNMDKGFYDLESKNFVKENDFYKLQ